MCTLFTTDLATVFRFVCFCVICYVICDWLLLCTYFISWMHACHSAGKWYVTVHSKSAKLSNEKYKTHWADALLTSSVVCNCKMVTSTTEQGYIYRDKNKAKSLSRAAKTKEESGIIRKIPKQLNVYVFVMHLFEKFFLFFFWWAHGTRFRNKKFKTRNTG